MEGNLITKNNGPQIREVGVKMMKKPNPVYMVRKSQPFDVETEEGVMHGEPGDYVVYDPMSGHVWPVKADYVEMHYEEVL